MSRSFHTSTQDGQGGGGGGRGSCTLPPFDSAEARSRWCERLETSSGVGQPWANGKLCWQRCVRGWNCLTVHSWPAKSSLLHVCARGQSRVCVRSRVCGAFVGLLLIVRLTLRDEQRWESLSVIISVSLLKKRNPPLTMLKCQKLNHNLVDSK